MPRRSTARSRSSFSRRERLISLAGQDVGPGVVDPGIDSSEPAPELGRKRGQVLLPADVGTHDLGTPAEAPDFSRGALRPLAVPPVGDGEVGPCLRTGDRDRLSDAAGGSGDQYDFPVQRHAVSPRHAGRH